MARGAGATEKTATGATVKGKAARAGG
jgi:hypothetical protein